MATKFEERWNFEETPRFLKNLPSAGRSPGNFGFELNRQTEKAMEAIEGDMCHVSHIGRPPNLHWRRRRCSSAAPNQRFPERSNQKGQNRKLIPLPFPFFLFFFFNFHTLLFFHSGSVNKGNWVRPIIGCETTTWPTRTAWGWRQLKHFRHIFNNNINNNNIFIIIVVVIIGIILLVVLHQEKARFWWIRVSFKKRVSEGETWPSLLCLPSEMNHVIWEKTKRKR